MNTVVRTLRHGLGNFRQKSLDEGKDVPFDEKYQLTSTVLGVGNYAQVVLARDLRTNATVAVKVIDKSKLSAKELTKTDEEAKILYGLRHKNVVKVLDFHDDPSSDSFYIVMEHISGGDLFKKIVDGERKFTEAESKRIIYKLADALLYCKNRGIIHRDVKPENILLTDKDEVKLADFNLSKKLDTDVANFSLLETMCGTPNYVAPEVISGTPYDYKCDVWSVGVISFLLLSGGYLPFFLPSTANESEASRGELLRIVRAGRWRFVPDRAWQGVSSSARDFVSKCLRKNPSERMSYEQLLAHPWLKSVGSSLEGSSGELIDLSEMKALNERREKALLMFKQVSVTNTAVGIFQSMMGEDEDEEEEGNQAEDTTFNEGEAHLQMSGLGVFENDF